MKSIYLIYKSLPTTDVFRWVNLLPFLGLLLTQTSIGTLRPSPNDLSSLACNTTLEAPLKAQDFLSHFTALTNPERRPLLALSQPGLLYVSFSAFQDQQRGLPFPMGQILGALIDTLASSQALSPTDEAEVLRFFTRPARPPEGYGFGAEIMTSIGEGSRRLPRLKSILAENPHRNVFALTSDNHLLGVFIRSSALVGATLSTDDTSTPSDHPELTWELPPLDQSLPARLLLSWIANLEFPEPNDRAELHEIMDTFRDSELMADLRDRVSAEDVAINLEGIDERLKTLAQNATSDLSNDEAYRRREHSEGQNRILLEYQRFLKSIYPQGTITASRSPESKAPATSDMESSDTALTTQEIFYTSVQHELKLRRPPGSSDGRSLFLSRNFWAPGFKHLRRHDLSALQNLAEQVATALTHLLDLPPGRRTPHLLVASQPYTLNGSSSPIHIHVFRTKFKMGRTTREYRIPFFYIEGQILVPEIHAGEEHSAVSQQRVSATFVEFTESRSTP